MRNSRLQNKVSESVVTLPVCAALGVLVWLWNTMQSAEGLCPRTVSVPLIAAATTWIIMETNNRNSLLRVRSRMVSVVWLVCICMMSFSHQFSDGWIAALSLAASTYLLLGTYQEHEPVFQTFHSSFLLGICVIAVPWTAVMIPLYWWYMLVFLRCITWRSFWAFIIGLMLPLWFTLGWCIFQGSYDFLLERLSELAFPQVLTIDAYKPFFDWKNGTNLTLALIVLLSLLGGIHYLRNYYQDKIRTRMLLYIYVMQTVVCMAVIAIQPCLVERMMLPLVVCCSPLIAHYFALTSKRLTNLVFILAVVLAVAITTLNMGLWKL